MSVISLYEEEWNRLLDQARKLIKNLLELDELCKEYFKEPDEEVQKLYKKVMECYQKEYQELLWIVYSKLSMFKGKLIHIPYKEGFWKENAMLFIVANAVNQSRLPLYLNPASIFDEKSMQIFFKEIEKYHSDSKVYEKYSNFIKCGFTHCREEDYIKDLILPC